MKLPNIAIDGPAASGKTTVARRLAIHLGLVFLDTGAMYRSVAWTALHKGLDCTDEAMMTSLAKELDMQILSDESELGYKIIVEGRDITDELHEPCIDKVVSLVAKISGVRQEMVRRQQDMASKGGIIMVGRDITTVVMPEAEYKFYLDADVIERAHRRYLELQEQGDPIDESTVLEQLKERDYLDTHRSDSPLRLVEGVERFDTTGLAILEVVEILSKRCGAKSLFEG